jgi:hypothetical protein
MRLLGAGRRRWALPARALLALSLSLRCAAYPNYAGNDNTPTRARPHAAVALLQRCSRASLFL